MFKNQTANNQVGYNTPFTPTSTWKWLVGPQSSHSPRTTLAQSIPTLPRPTLPLYKAKIMTESIIPSKSFTGLLILSTSSSTSPPTPFLTLNELLAEPLPTPQPCQDMSATVSFMESCGFPITSGYSELISPQSETFSANLLSGSRQPLPSVTSSSAMPSNILQTSGSASSIWTSDSGNPQLLLTSTPPHLITISISTAAIQVQPQIVQTSTTLISTATHPYTSRSATSVSSPLPASTVPTHISRSVVIAGIALGSMGVVLLFFLAIQVLRACWARRVRLSPAELELRKAQEQTSHPLSAYARMSSAASPILPQWHWRLQSPQISAAAPVDDEICVHSARLAESSSSENPKNGVEISHPTTIGRPELKSLATSPHKSSAKKRTTLNSLLPPAIPSPWSWVSSRTSATTPSRFSFDSRGRRRRSDPFDLEGKDFDFNC